MKKKIVFLAAAILFVFMLCTACSLHTHSFGEWQCSDETYHSRSCSCGKSEKEEHNFEDGKCTVCGYDKSSGTPGGSGNPGSSQGGDSNHPEQDDNDQKQPHGVLEFEKNENSYSVIGIGTCKDTDIVIPSTYNNLPVTSIGEYAFNGCINLLSITIPESLTSIGEDAFLGCNLKEVHYKGNIASWCKIEFENSSSNPLSCGAKLYMEDKLVTDLQIPETVTGINDCEFNGCGSITSVTIPDSVTNIGKYAFNNCINLLSVTISESVTNIGDYAFEGCYKLVEIYNLSETLTIAQYSPDNGFLGYNALDIYTDKETQSKIIKVDDYLFYDGDTGYLLGYEGNDTKLTLPDYNGKNYEIYQFAFNDCNNITSVTIPSNVTSIGYRAFESCHKLVEVYNLSETLTIIKGSEIDGYVGYNALDIYTDKETQSKIIKVDDYLFYDGDTGYLLGYEGNDTKLTLPDYNGKNYEIYQFAFNDCNNITSVTIPSNVTSIGDMAFDDCYILKEVHYKGDITSWCDINFYDSNPLSYGAKLYMEDKLVTDLQIPETITEIKDCAFNGCGSITSVTVPESVTSIGKYAFRGCSSLTSIVIPDSVMSIGRSAFGYCRNLKNVTFGENSKLTNIEDFAFADCDRLTSIVIPEGVTGIGDYAFEDCYRLVEVYNLSKLKIEKGSENNGYAGYYAFNIYNNNTTQSKIREKSNYLFYEDNNKVYLFGYKGNDLELTLPDDKYEINKFAFAGYYLTNITIPESLTSIGEDAFLGCNLKEVHYKGNIASWCKIEFENSSSNPLSCGAKLYMEDKLVTDLQIPETETEINDCAFNGCGSITSVTIPDSVTNIGNGAFARCGRLTNIVIPDSVMSIGNGAFYYCSSLTSITIPGSVTNIGAYAFGYCRNLKNVTFGENSKLTNIGNGAFADCDRLTSMVIPEGVTSIGNGAFNGCNNLKNVTFGDNSKLASIGNRAFYNCSSLTSITIPESVTSIGEYAFNGCSGLTSITVPFVGASIDRPLKFSFIFGGGYNGDIYLDEFVPTSLKTVIITGGSEICAYAFSGCSGIESITLPKTLKSIGDRAFGYCYGLQKVIINDVSAWCNIDFGADANPLTRTPHLYLNDEEITELNIPEGVTEIKAGAFSGSNITSVIIPKSITSIGTGAFRGCNLKEVHYKGNIASWCKIEFENSSSNPLSCSAKLYMEDKLVTDLQIPETVTEIKDCAFNGCGSITSVTVPGSVTNIGKYAFNNCINLLSVTISESVTNIGDYAFEGCYKLVEIYNLSETLTIAKDSQDNGFLGYYALDIYTDKNAKSKIKEKDNYLFYENNNKVYLLGYKGNDIKLTLPDDEDKTYEIYKYTFYKSNITSITIPGSVTNIGNGAFNGCNNLKNVTFGDNSKLTNIGNGAFYYCDRLTSMVIPEGVTSIGKGAFNGCNSLTSVTFENPNGWKAYASLDSEDGTDVSDFGDPAAAAEYLRKLDYSYVLKRG